MLKRRQWRLRSMLKQVRSSHSQLHQQQEEVLDVAAVLRSGVPIDKKTYAELLRDCRDVILGRQIHAHLIQTRMLDKSPYLGDRLVQMYLSSGSMRDAQQVFEKMQYKSVVSSTLMISAYAQRGHLGMALQLFRQMQLDGIRPDKVAFLAALTAVGSGGCVEEARFLHRLLVERGLRFELVLGNALVNTYGKFHCIEEARSVFDSIQEPDVISWNSIVAAYAEAGDTQEALFMFRVMQLEGFKPGNVTCVIVLNTCESPGALKLGKLVHACILEGGYETKNRIVGNSLLHMYGQCGSPADAQVTFDGMEDRDVVSWTAVLAAYALQGQFRQALRIFSRMLLEGVEVDGVTLVTLLHACSRPQLSSGRKLHGLACEAGLDKGMVLGNTLVSMYGRCGSLEEARRVFDALPRKDDVLSWNILIAIYSQFGLPKKCLELFWDMTNNRQVKPDKATFVSVLNSSASLEEGRLVHDLILEQDLETEAGVGTSLVNFYGKRGHIEEARRIFDGMPTKLPVSWNCLMSAYLRWGHYEEALEIYRSMKNEVRPNRITFVEALNACSILSLLPQGMKIHGEITESSEVDDTDPVVTTSLIVMYSKCGTLEQACQVFEAMRRSKMADITVEVVEAWNTMVGAYSHHGKPRDAVQLFRTMILESVQPDKVSFLNALSAFSHAGLISEALECFTSMVVDYELDRSERHYGCIIDLLGRLGRLDEAEAFIFSVPVETNWIMWGSFLGACRTHGELSRAQLAAEIALSRLDEEDQAPFGVLLSSIFAEDGRDFAPPPDSSRAVR